MGVYRYVGGSGAEIHDSPYVFKSFGQLVELPDDVAKKAIEGRIPLVPVTVWDDVGFSETEAKRHARFETHAVASPEFLAKREAVWRKAVEHHEDVKGSSQEPADTKEEGVTHA